MHILGYIDKDKIFLPVMSPDIRHEFPVFIPQVFTAALPQSHREYKIVRLCSRRASRIRSYRMDVLDLDQSYSGGAGSARSGQVPLGLVPMSPSGTQAVYSSSQLLGTPQLSYFKSVSLKSELFQIQSLQHTVNSPV
jgi:hypothetical protein